MSIISLNANAMAQCSPSDIEELTAQVVDATTSTNQMTDELVQLNNALIEFEDRHSVYKVTLSKVKSNMRNISSKL